jgi:hypothetical protein
MPIYTNFFSSLVKTGQRLPRLLCPKVKKDVASRLGAGDWTWTCGRAMGDCLSQHTRARYIPREKEEEQSGDEGEGRHFSVTEEEEQQPPPEGSSLLAAYKFATSEWIRAQLAVGHCPKRKEGIFEKRMRVD